MDKEIRNCQNCKQKFIVDEDDFNFYKKIDVPAPTFCFTCATQRRIAWRNERCLYKRKCSAPGHEEEIFSIYSPDKNYTVYDEKYWWSDAWDPLSYGQNYDFQKPFFSQYREFLEKVPLIALSTTNMVNCQFCNVAEGDKGCYLISASWRNENTMFSNRIANNKDSVDIYVGDSAEMSYELINCSKGYKLKFSQNCTECSDSFFLFDCVGCINCFGCTNLRNKSYYYFNEPLSKEEYLSKIKKFNSGSSRAIEEAKKKFEELKLKSIHRYAQIIKSVDSTGDNLIAVKNCKFSFDLVGKPSCEDCKYSHWGGYAVKDAWSSGPGIGEGERLYEAFDSGIQGSNIFFSGIVYGSYNIQYSLNCHGSKNLFGCYGLRGKEYCILNKQYSKEEYLDLLPKIIKQMNEMPYIDKQGINYKYGEFMPIELSLFDYNQTIAQDYFPLSKEFAEKKNYGWKLSEAKNYNISVKAENLPDDIKDVDTEILNAVIECAHVAPPTGGCNEGCATAFKITSQELEFYKKMELPLPRLCFNCRHSQRIKKRNPMRLWHRKCSCEGQIAKGKGQYNNTITHFHGNDPCPNEFETSYSPDRPEIIYCENCYQQEVV